MWFLNLLLLSSNMLTGWGKNAVHNAEHGARQILNNSTGYDVNFELFSRDSTRHWNQSNVDGYQSNDAVDPNKCELELCSKCVSRFRHHVYYSEAVFVYLNLIPQEGVNIIGDNSTVGENIWVWTFYGRDGGLEFLKWPMEFGIWSMGLLNSYVIKVPMDMHLFRTAGNCSNLRIGNTEDDKTITNALMNLSNALDAVINVDDKYAASFFCYKKRIFIDSDFVYVLCKHIVCPLEALKYQCCNNFYNTTYGNRTVGCRNEEFVYDPVSWILPTIVSIALFAICPLFLLKVAQKVMINDQAASHQLLNTTGYSEIGENDRITASHDFLFLNDTHHVTLFGTLFHPFRNCFRYMLSKDSTGCKSVMRRLLRYCLPFLSLSFILVQIALDYFYLREFVQISITKGVPLGFRSMLAGYEGSRHNFLPFLGGPYVAVGVYLFITFVLLGIPSSVSYLLTKGLPSSSTNEDRSPLCLKLSSTESFGSVKIRRKVGFDKIYAFLLGQLFMLINGKFWRRMLTVQFQRWNRFYCSQCLILMLPFYIVVCLLEIVMCVTYCGCPILSFGFIIIKAYCGRLWNHTNRRSFPLHVVVFLVTLVLVASVLYFFFMLCTIFMDACMFITRVVTFTFTGIVVYPKVSYGYIIFSFTVVYYIMQSLHDFSAKYQTLLKESISVCEQRQRANDANKLVARMDGFKGISKILFEHIIDEHCPRRKQVFLSFVKMLVILTILGLSLNVLDETDGFRELHIVMHVGTALFICAMPQIVKSTCRNSDNKFQRKRFRIELAKTVKTYSGYYNTGETSDSEHTEVE